MKKVLREWATAVLVPMPKKASVVSRSPIAQLPSFHMSEG